MNTDMVRLKHANGEISQKMTREHAAFIIAFTLSGERPKMIEIDKEEKLCAGGGKYARDVLNRGEKVKREGEKLLDR